MYRSRAVPFLLMKRLTPPYRYSQCGHFGCIGAGQILTRPSSNTPWKEQPKLRVVGHSGAGKKGPQLREKSWGQVQHAETRIGSKRRKRLPWGTNSRSTPRFASPQQRLLAGAFYSYIFWPRRMYRAASVAAHIAWILVRRMVRSSALLPHRRERRLAGIKQSPTQSPD
jgi:hypothetical protein